jgi:hypothetical protein
MRGENAIMIITTFKRATGVALTTALALAGTLSAIQPAAAQYAVPGAPGVASVSVVQGSVVVARADSGEQFGATVNTPMLAGDYISTAGGSRTEVQFDGISMLRLASNSQVRLVNLNPGSREAQLAYGTAELAELQGSDGNPQIDTPAVSVRANGTGDYRVSVFNNGETEVTVRSGSATVFSNAGSQTLTPGSTLVAFGDYNNPSISFQGAIGLDAFDHFNIDRDAAIVASYNANQYLAPSLAGYANFASYGQWYNVPGYGQAWAPDNQNNDWSPYSNGQWVWEPGYGYTWVGNEPWGYVPYHYGNWFYSTAYNEWMWEPPAYSYQTNTDTLASAWLPALVAFFLTGANGNAGYPYGYANVGWVPLAPGEQYVPWYAGFGANAGFPQTAFATGSNVTYITNVYRNIKYVRVIKVIDIRRFRDGDDRHPIVMRPDELRHVAIVRGSIPIVPVRATVGLPRAAKEIAISDRFHETVFAAKAPAITTASFAKQQADLHTIVSAKPAIVEVKPHAAAVEHPVYQAPAEHRTFQAPVEVTKPVAAPKPVEKPVAKPVEKPVEQPAPVHTMAPRPVAPERTPAPERPFVPQRTVAPPVPQRTEAPAVEHTASPVQQRFEPPVRRTAAPAQPEHTATPVQQRPVLQSAPQTAPHAAATPKPEPTKKDKDKPTPPPLG